MGTKEVEIGTGRISDDLIHSAIKGTEEEIFDAAANGNDEVSDEDDGGRSLEDMEDDTTEADEADDGADDQDEGEAQRDPKTGRFTAKQQNEPQPKPAAKQAQQTQPQERQEPQDQHDDQHDDGRVPRGALRDERQRRQAAEREVSDLRESSQREIAAINQRLDAMLQSFSTLMQRQAPPPPAPQPAKEEEQVDLFQDPDRYIAQRLERMAQPLLEQNRSVADALRATRYELSMSRAELKHGETFQAALTAFGKLNPQNPNDFQTGRSIANAPDPGDAMVRWYKQQTALAEMGDDPEAYRQRVRDQLLKDPEFLKQVAENLRAEATGGARAPNGQRPRSVTRLPPSLNNARGGSTAQTADPRSFDNSDQAVFESAWE